MSDYERGRIDRENELIALFDEYEIIELIGGGYMLKPRWEKHGWTGITHKTGSLSSYFRNGCRCDTCRAFVSSYQKERRLMRKKVLS